MTTMINTKPLYSLLEKVTFGQGLYKTVNEVRLKLPAKYIRYFPSDYESENYTFLKTYCKQGAVVIDIGAHIGLFGAIATKLAGESGKVFSFEPAPNTFPVLEQTIRINKLDHLMEPVNQAMSKETGTTTFFISADEADVSNSLVSYKVDRKLIGVEVEINTIDNFVAERNLMQLDFIKIDAEGVEYDVLQGGIETFRTLKPHIILAIHPEPIVKKGDTMEEIYDLLAAIDYKILCNKFPISKQAFCSRKDMFDLQLIPN